MANTQHGERLLATACVIGKHLGEAGSTALAAKALSS